MNIRPITPSFSGRLQFVDKKVDKETDVPMISSVINVDANKVEQVIEYSTKPYVFDRFLPYDKQQKIVTRSRLIMDSGIQYDFAMPFKELYLEVMIAQKQPEGHITEIN